MMTNEADAERLKGEIKAEFEPVADELDAVSRKYILGLASRDGWSESQAEWLDKLAKQPFFQAVADGVPGEDAIQIAYAEAKRQLSVGYFENALERGQDRYAAFLTVVDLEKQVIERRGEAAPAYPDNVLVAACRAVVEAAEQGLSTAEQIDIGYAVIRGASSQAPAPVAPH